MTRIPRRQPARWSGLGCGCLIVLIALAALICFLTSMTFGEHAVPDTAALSPGTCACTGPLVGPSAVDSHQLVKSCVICGFTPWPAADTTHR